MSPEVTAAWIAAGVGVLTVAATVAAQYFGRRATSRDTQKALAQQGEQLDRTLAEQREQLDRTLAEQRTRTLNERFATAAGQLGSDKPPEVRLAGVYAMAGLADDWPENRQTCVDVLCGYLRIPYEPDPGDEALQEDRHTFRASREVRHTVIRVITAHLKANAPWHGLNFDFTDVVFDGGDFADARFSGGEVSFRGTQFSGGTVDFRMAEFSGGEVSFGGAAFSGGRVDFRGAEFSVGTVDFRLAAFSGGTVGFGGAEFSGGTVDFSGAHFSDGRVDFRAAEFSDGRVIFRDVRFSGGRVGFRSAAFSGGRVGFGGAAFSGSTFDFDDAEFSGGTVDFSDPGDWSFPPVFPWTGTPPPGVKLPEILT
jgi:uncharacterized protein YjbI with pentapeptide repeats